MVKAAIEATESEAEAGPVTFGALEVQVTSWLGAGRAGRHPGVPWVRGKHWEPLGQL